MHKYNNRYRQYFCEANRYYCGLTNEHQAKESGDRAPDLRCAPAFSRACRRVLGMQEEVLPNLGFNNTPFIYRLLPSLGPVLRQQGNREF